MSPRLPSLHLGTSLDLCTQRWGQGSSPELLLVLGAQSVSHCHPAVISGALGIH